MDTLVRRTADTIYVGQPIQGTNPMKIVATTAKSIQVIHSKVHGLNAIYSKVIVLLSSDRDIHVEDFLAYELAPIPTAMFTEDGSLH